MALLWRHVLWAIAVWMLQLEWQQHQCIPALMQSAFEISKEGSFIIAVKNPAKLGGAPGRQLGLEQKVEYSQEKRDEFKVGGGLWWLSGQVGKPCTESAGAAGWVGLGVYPGRAGGAAGPAASAGGHWRALGRRQARVQLRVDDALCPPPSPPILPAGVRLDPGPRQPAAGLRALRVPARGHCRGAGG